MTGWNLPPGVTTDMIERAYGWDEPTQRRCSCGAFLPAKPGRTENWEDALECDGSVVAYEEPYEEGIIQILGEEYRGKTYTITGSACGLDRAPHAPHREIENAGTTGFWHCRKCGTEYLAEV